MCGLGAARTAAGAPFPGQAAGTPGWDDGAAPREAVVSRPNRCSPVMCRPMTGMVGQMRVLGVDPGLTRCGLGVIDGEPGRTLRLVATGVGSTPGGDEVRVRPLAPEEQVGGWAAAVPPGAGAGGRGLQRPHGGTG